jgi:hypothetical protein
MCKTADNAAEKHPEFFVPRALTGALIMDCHL